MFEFNENGDFVEYYNYDNNLTIRMGISSEEEFTQAYQHAYEKIQAVKQNQSQETLER